MSNKMINCSGLRRNLVPLALIAVVLAIALLSWMLPPFTLLMGLLFLPLLDKEWSLPKRVSYKLHSKIWLYCSLFLFIIFVVKHDVVLYALITVFIVALPEEWFFRAYLMKQMQVLNTGGKHKLRANILSTIAFSLLHAITRGVPIGLEVFFPSLLFGWLYQRTNDLFFCVFVHAVSNVMFVLVLEEHVSVIRKMIGYSV